MTVRDLIRGSLRLIGAIASGETPAAAEQADALFTLNDILESWSNQSLLVPSRVREVFTLVAAQQTYTFGLTGNFNSARPQNIDHVAVIDGASNPPAEIPTEILNWDQWAAISQKSMQSTFPTRVYADEASPLKNLSFWPVPSGGLSVVIYSWKPLTAFSSADDALSMPPGFAKALRYELALELCPEYGKPVPDVVAAKAQETKAEVKRMNIKPIYVGVDSALLSGGKPYNIYTGS